MCVNSRRLAGYGVVGGDLFSKAGSFLVQQGLGFCKA
jgi:hypothetical protein